MALSALRTRDGRVRWWLGLVLLVAIAPMVTGCYGRFQLTKAVYRFNGEASENRAVQSIVMWVLIIIPVYGLAMIGDAVVIHLIEFWSGKPIDIGCATEEDGTRFALEPTGNGRDAVMTVSRDGEILARATFVRISEGEFEVRDNEGRLAGKVVRTPAGDLLLTDAQGTTIRTVSAQELASVAGI